LESKEQISKEIYTALKVREKMFCVDFLLMDENKTLFKLKELEYLERICEKVGEISVNGNMGIVEQLGKMIGVQNG